jgi:Chagasin family peptidase inhibitor I42
VPTIANIAPTSLSTFYQGLGHVTRRADILLPFRRGYPSTIVPSVAPADKPLVSMHMFRKTKQWIVIFGALAVLASLQSCISSQSTGSDILLKLNSARSVEVSSIEMIVVELDGNAGNGYSWTLMTYDKAVLSLLDQGKRALAKPVDGNTFTSFFKLKPLRSGASKIVFGLMPPGRSIPEQTLEFFVAVK